MISTPPVSLSHFFFISVLTFGFSSICICEAAVVKIGPWGANEGEAHDIDVLPCRLESVAICSSDYVESFGFSYSDRSGHQHTAGPWGRPGGNTHTVSDGLVNFRI